MATSEVFSLDIYCGKEDKCSLLIFHEESNSEEELKKVLDNYLQNHDHLDRLRCTFGSTFIHCEISRRSESLLKMVVPL